MAGALQSDELGNVLETLRKHVLLAERDDRDGSQPQSKQLIAAASIVGHVDGYEIDAFFRKKLFRSEAATSSGLGEEDELFGCAHERGRRRGARRLLSGGSPRQPGCGCG